MKFRTHFDIGLLIILVIATVLRLYQPAHAPYWVDVASTLSASTKLAHDHQMVWLGNPSAWEGLTAHSPFSVYFTAIPMFFFKQPVVAYIWFNIWGILTVLLTYYAVKRYFGINAARISSLTLAISPLAIFWSEFVWNPNIAPLFIVGWWWTALLGYQENKQWVQMAHWVLLSLIIQAQAALAVLIPASVLLFCWYVVSTTKKRQAISSFAIGIVVSFIMAIPWFYGLYGEAQGWLYTPFGVGNTKPEGLVFILPSLNTLFEQFFHSVSGFHHWSGSRAMLIDPNRADWWPSEQINVVLALQGLITLLGLGGFFWVGFRRFDKNKSLSYIFTTLSALTPFLFFFVGTRVSDFYLQPVTYFGAIIFGVVMAYIWQHQKLLTVFLLLPLVITQLWLAAARHDWYVHGENRVTTTLAEIEQLLQQWQSPTGDIVFIADETNVSPFTVQEWSITMDAFDEQYPIRTIHETRSIPVAQTSSTLVSLAMSPIIFDNYGIGQPVDIGGGGYFRYLVVRPDDLPVPDFVPSGEATYTDLLRVEGIITDDILDDTLPLIIRWQPLQMSLQQYQFSVRLLDSEGNRIAQVDGATLEPGVWHVSDTVMTRFNMMLPENAPDQMDWQFELLVYSYPQIENVMLTDGSGVALQLYSR